MRLLLARVGVPYSPATGLPIESQTVSPDGRPGHGAAGGHPALPARADRARPQGRVPQGARRAAEARLPAGQGRRQDATSSTRSPALDKKLQARHRGGGRPHRRRATSSATGSPISFETALEPGRRPRRSPRTPIRRRAARSSRRSSPARSRASPSPRSSRGCSRSTPRSAPARPATGSAPSCSSTRTWSCPTSSRSLREGAVAPWAQVDLAILHADARQPRPALQVQSMHTPWHDLPEKMRAGDPLRLGRRAGHDDATTTALRQLRDRPGRSRA